jgi:phage/plasmid-associated DNA primase
LVAVANGTLDLRTREVSEWNAKHLLRRKLEVIYDPTKEAPDSTAFSALLEI